MTKTEYTAKRRAAHTAALATLHAEPATADAGAMLQKLRRLEMATHRAATDFCNGAMPQDLWEQTKDRARARTAAIFGGKLPPTFFVNGDPRGYALKLETAPAGMETDWGRNGILAPDFNH
jgi:hypothetical protein